MKKKRTCTNSKVSVVVVDRGSSCMMMRIEKEMKPRIISSLYTLERIFR